MSATQKDVPPITPALGQLEPLVNDALTQLDANRLMERIRNHDHTLWKPSPTDIANRLGWLTSPDKMVEATDEINAVVEELRREGFTHALLMGMGGSSLAPEVFRKTFGVKQGYLDLAVLDSTDPRTVRNYTHIVDSVKTVYIVSTKSGGTVETLSFFKYFFNKTVETLGPENAGSRFIAITDPGSRLETLGRDLGFRKIFLNDPDIGGRYSALSYFGLVPAALIGINLTTLLNRAVTMAAPNRTPGLHLGVLMAELAKIGRDKLTLIMSPAIASMGAWIEQLIAESTGKEGKGILPVDGETVLGPNAYGNDRLFVHLHMIGDTTHDAQVDRLKQGGHPVVTIELADKFDLGGEFFRWEMATAVAGHRMEINPFDQPNVEAAKVSARQMLTAYAESGHLPETKPALIDANITAYADLQADTIEALVHHFFSKAWEDDGAHLRPYVAIQAYLHPSADTDIALHTLRTAIQSQFKWATTVGYGPRFLHSTGQLHKGDGGRGIFVQLTDDIKNASDPSGENSSVDIDIPNSPGSATPSITFGTLLAAQALGDRQALIDADRRIIRFHLGKEALSGLERLTRIVSALPPLTTG